MDKDEDMMKIRFANVVKQILAERSLSQQEMADKYLDVSQACVRDYVGGEKTLPGKVRTETMRRIAKLYGSTTDDLMDYFETGKWKRRLTIQEVEVFVRSIQEPRILLGLMQLIQNVLEQRLSVLPEIPVQKEFNPYSKIIEPLEQEKKNVPSGYQWEVLLRAFGITEEEVDLLYAGETVQYATIMKLSKLLRMEMEPFQDLILSEPKSESIEISKIPIETPEELECTDGEHCGESEPAPIS